MAFDSGMLAAVINELQSKITGSRIEKIHQPARDELVLSLRPEGGGESLRLLICAGASSPRINLTSLEISNPPAPPMFTQLLRKHLSGAKILSVRQLGFERAAEIEFEAHDDMNFKTTKYLIVEVMGKYSNVIFCNAEHKIISPLRSVDFTTSSKRQLMPGMRYEEPPKQEKIDPLTASRKEFLDLYNKSADEDYRFIMNNYMGISALIAREIAQGVSGDGNMLWKRFCEVTDRIKNRDFVPTLVSDENGKPIEYAFIDIKQYANRANITHPDSFGALIDEYFFNRERLERIKQKSGDVMKMLDNARSRLVKKLNALQSDLRACRDKDKFRRWGDLITSNIYLIKKGANTAELIDYYSEDLSTVTVPLDSKLTASQNAQRYYKKYNKLKNGETEIAKQIRIAEEELDYISGVYESFSIAENESDIGEIRRELYESGYASRMKNYTPGKHPIPKPLEFVTTNGYRVVCGKNNIQNEQVTHKIASRGDYWFHSKNFHGSHVVMICNGDDPPAEDFTEACMIAAYYSQARDGKNVDVDYTRVYNLKKPPNAKPGFVIYHTNYSATVTPDRSTIERLKRK